MSEVSATVLHRVALILEFGTLGNEALPSLLATTLDEVAAGFGRHASAKTVLVLARALRWLVGPFHLFR